ncbi:MULTISPECIES: hypothetical protein [Halorussus]|uniref:hypothetical protein n=1 Tax=Halorussus TaxID=1070314 RepID=UPI00209CD080|nr:hypothetical protein [Halorussus vallis]USZ75949.1 hypothetical protein NGM07_01180 [Halorussus vallis]
MERRYTFVSAKSFIAEQPSLDSPIGTTYGAVATTTEEAERLFDWKRWNDSGHSKPYRILEEGEACLCTLVVVVHPEERLATEESAIENGSAEYTVKIERKDQTPDPDLPDPVFSYALDKWELNGAKPPSDVSITTE